MIAHPLLVGAVAKALFAIFVEGRHADKVIEYTLRQNPKAGSRDRAFIAEHTYEIVRYFRLYAAVLDYMPKTENDFWKLTGIHLVLNGGYMPGELPESARPKSLPRIQALLKSVEENRAIKESIPDWLDALGVAELGDLWPNTLRALNKPAQVVLRANRLKITRDALAGLLKEEQIEARPAGTVGDALVLSRRQNVFQTKAFKAGLFEVQDFSSQLVAPLLAPEPGMRVVDACAGGGGKSLHIAALMQGKGSIIALDTLGWKLDELKVRARRAGVHNIETRVIENSKTIKRLANSADRLLLDVPCSGLGVLRRNPDSKWKITPEQIAQLQTVQQDILQQYSGIVKPGGRMVYATCSVLPSENNHQVQTFLASPPGSQFRLLAENVILPQDNGFDGFYMALLERLVG